MPLSPFARANRIRKYRGVFAIPSPTRSSMPQRKQHLIVIHGRATKPSEKEKRRLVRLSVIHGLERVSKSAATKIRTGKVKMSLAYFGDISNAEMIRANKKSSSELKGRDPLHPGTPCEKSGSYDSDLKELFEVSKFSKAAYRKLLKEVPDSRMLDNVASAVSGVLNLIGLSDNVIRAATPDMGAYLTTRKVGSEVRERLQKYLEPSLRRGDDICLVAHSMGCIVSYDVLWKYSHMSEYRAIRERNISRWITIGNPLGEPGVQDNLIDAHEAAEDRYPRNVRRWINVAAHDDFVAHDEDIEDDFREMKRHGHIGRIQDKEIYNFWTGSSGSNPHKLYGYLDHPKVAGEIADWIR